MNEAGLCQDGKLGNLIFEENQHTENEDIRKDKCSAGFIFRLVFVEKYPIACVATLECCCISVVAEATD